MERNFSVPDADAFEIVSEIRISKHFQAPAISFRHDPVYCPICGKEAGKLPETFDKAFCWECFREFRISTGKLEPLEKPALPNSNFTECVLCGKKKVASTVNKNGICDRCRKMTRAYPAGGICALCDNEAEKIHYKTGYCYTCMNRIYREKRKKAKNE